MTGRTYLPDVNVIVASVRADHVHHEPAREFLESARGAGGGFQVPVDVLAAAMRILTLPVWLQPETSETAGSLLAAWVRAAGAEVVSHPPATWQVLSELARTLDLTPRAIPDALLASSAVASRATVVTFDLGFGRFPGLRTEILTSSR